MKSSKGNYPEKKESEGRRKVEVAKERPACGSGPVGVFWEDKWISYDCEWTHSSPSLFTLQIQEENQWTRLLVVRRLKEWSARLNQWTRVETQSMNYFIPIGKGAKPLDSYSFLHKKSERESLGNKGAFMRSEEDERPIHQRKDRGS